jgi:hypothetical protein
MDPASHWTAASVNLECTKTSDELMDDLDEARDEQQDLEVAS